ncbi:protein kinase domain-containing protein [Pseudonocardia charpentierae]|uniref:Protein kinase n=1 Tax=Pseudonocardia charpentierae TaxID=3075545 RepID=A0ABU2N7U8_9PSEU|nr:protein kinase [Pseudonocardia sp. DSM 45834]MDT0350025.1 protein kinase [Pseudonocardia sp. DSM 45834]
MWSPGDVVLGVYEVRDVVSTGGMGLVYRVWHRQWEMELAVKTPREELVASPADAERFEAEAEAWVGLGAHPHVVTCAYVRRVDGTPRVFAEWVDGGSLAEAVRDRALYRGDHRSAVRRILDLAIQCAWGLEHAHGRGVVHQDVKPANVMLDRGGAAKVTDFGLANGRVPGGGREPLVTVNGMTVEYCSPEQARGERLGPATDVWSWAVSVFEMFAGRPPVMFGPAAAAEFAEFLGTGADDPAVPPMPPGLVDLLRRCLAEDPGDRPTTFGAIADDLADVYRGTVFEPYPRHRPDEAPLLADALSNRALSLMDLGHADRADQFWEEALRVDPYHPHATYNRGLRKWRRGLQTDRELIAELDAVRLGQASDRTADVLLALVHIERGDKESALRLLRHLPDSPEAAAARELPDRRVMRIPGPTLSSGAHPIALSADGRVATVTLRHREVEVWSLEAERVVQRLVGHEGHLWSVSLSADGRVVASADGRGQVRVWDTITGECTREVDLPPEAVQSVAVSPDGTVVATAGADGSVRILGDTVDVVDAGPAGHGPGLGGAIAISADNRRVAVFDGYTWTLRVLDARTGEVLWTVGRLRLHCAISPTARFALSATEGDEMLLLDLTTFEVRPLGGAQLWNRGSGWLAVSDDGRTAVNAADIVLRSWRLDENRCMFSTTVDSHNPMDVALSADGRTVLAVLASRTPRVLHSTGVVHVPEPGPIAPWSYARPQPTDRIAGDALVAEENLDLAGDLLETGRLADARRQLDIVRRMPAYRRHPRLRALWRRVGTFSERSTFAGVWPTRRFDDVMSSAVTRDLRFAFVDLYRGVRVLDLRSGQMVDSPDRHEFRFEFTTACSDDRHLIAEDSERAEVLWDLKTARRAGVIVRDDNGNPTLTVENPAFEFLRRDGISVLRNRMTGQRVHGWSARTDERVVLWGDVAVLVNNDGRIRVLDARTLTAGRQARMPAGELVRMRLTRADGAVETTGQGPVVASSDGRVVVATRANFSNSGLVMVSVAGSPEVVARVDDDNVVSLALTADGDLLLTASRRVIRLWHVPTGKLVTEIECRQDINTIGMSADGCAVLAVVGYRDIQCWELDWDYQTRV